MTQVPAGGRRNSVLFPQGQDGPPGDKGDDGEAGQTVSPLMTSRDPTWLLAGRCRALLGFATCFVHFLEKPKPCKLVGSILNSDRTVSSLLEARDRCTSG